MVISANPELTALEVISVLQRTAAKDLNIDPYPRTPPASFDPNPDWDISPAAFFSDPAFQNIGGPDGTWSPWFGHGRVDAQAAVARESLSGVVHVPEGDLPQFVPALGAAWLGQQRLSKIASGEADTALAAAGRAPRT